MPYYKEGDPAAEETDIAAAIKNKFKWRWISYVTGDGRAISQRCKKLTKPGSVFCGPCNREVKYSNRGKIALKEHADHDRHKAAIEVRSMF